MKSVLKLTQQEIIDAVCEYARSRGHDITGRVETQLNPYTTQPSVDALSMELVLNVKEELRHESR